uniref:Uncharacterized protein n=1 Tax=Arundo donax TaxID=35708 RepID=A0A0A9B749_ARUDO
MQQMTRLPLECPLDTVSHINHLLR